MFCYGRRVRKLGIVMAVVVGAGCRVGFQERPDGQPPVDAIPPDGPALLACGQAARFPMAKAPLQLAATATTDGYNLITSDGSEVRGFAYRFVDDALVAQRGDVPLFTGVVGEITTIATGGQTLLGVTSGPPAGAAGGNFGPIYDTTTLIPLDAQLDPAAAPATHSAWIGGTGSLARNASGALGFLGTKVPSDEIDVRIVAADGTARGPSHVVIPGGGISPSLTAAGDEFLVVWSKYADFANVYASLSTITSESSLPRVQPIVINKASMNDAFNARAAHLPASGTSLIAWTQKPGDPLDHIWISLRDRDLNEIVTKEIGEGNQAMVVAGERDFLVAWRVDGIRLAAARVTPEGVVQPVTIEGTARDAVGLDLVVRNGQPALVWIEASDAGGATVRFDPLCGG